MMPKPKHIFILTGLFLYSTSGTSHVYSLFSVNDLAWGEILVGQLWPFGLTCQAQAKKRMINYWFKLALNNINCQIPLFSLEVKTIFRSKDKHGQCFEVY